MMNDHAFSYPMYQAFRDKNPDVLSGVASRFVTTVDVQKDNGVPNRARAELVSGNYFQVLGVGPAMGRLLEPKDDLIKDGSPYVVLSYGLWMNRFGGDANILNQAVLVNGHPMTVVGVAQQGFKGFEVGVNSELFIPMMMKRQVTPLWDDLDNKRSVWLNIFGRLRPGVSSQQALAAMTVLYHQELSQELKEMPDASKRFRERYPKNTLKLMPSASGMSGLREQFSTPLIVLMCMVGTLLLIACGNVANLLVARAVARQRGDLDPAVAGSESGRHRSTRPVGEFTALTCGRSLGAIGLFVDQSAAAARVAVSGYEPIVHLRPGSACGPLHCRPKRGDGDCLWHAACLSSHTLRHVHNSEKRSGQRLGNGRPAAAKEGSGDGANHAVAVAFDRRRIVRAESLQSDESEPGRADRTYADVLS
ncbi:MAG: ABC transporter permease [Bryobacteraceae bacterium]